jgi:3-hydroxyisobutyrate dehydrogenase-like beta-hydroxyacid dehydrogenase
MGAPVAAHLVNAGHDLRVFDLFPAAVEPVVAAGATAAASAAEAAVGAACVFLSLPAPGDVEAAVSGPGGVLDAEPRPERIVDLSTNSPAMVARLQQRCAEVGVGFVDAPVSGGRAKAQSGELSVLVGAGDDDFAAVEPLLECFAGEVFHVGPPGMGTVAKLVNNQLFLAAGELVQEAYVLGAAAGLEPSVLHRIIKASSAGPYAALAPLLLGRRFDDVIFRLDIAAKDLTLAVEAAGDYGVEVPATAAALSVYRDALEAGMGNEVFHATLKHLERAAGIELPPLTRTPRPS